MQNTSFKMPGWMKHKLESKFPGKISITSDMQMTPSRGLMSLSRVHMAAANIVWSLFHLGCHRSAASLWASNVSPLTQTIAHLWGSDPLLQFPHPPRGGPVQLTLLSPPLLPSSKFCIGLYIPFWWLVTPVHFQLVFCKHFCVSVMYISSQ